MGVCQSSRVVRRGGGPQRGTIDRYPLPVQGKHMASLCYPRRAKKEMEMLDVWRWPASKPASIMVLRSKDFGISRESWDTCHT